MDSILDYLISREFWISLVAVIGAVVLWVLMKRAGKRLVGRDGISSKTSGYIRGVLSVLKALLMVLLVVFVLQVNGVNVSSLLAGFGVAGVVVGLALQDLLKDLIMGTNIAWDNFFRVGDSICLGSDDEGRIEGKVIAFNGKVTKIRRFGNGNVITICNRDITRVEKLGDHQGVRIPAPYDIPVQKMREIMEEICRRAPEREYITKCILRGTVEFADSCILYAIRIYSAPDRRRSARRELLALVQEVYEERGIEIPFPQCDVHLK